MAIMRENGTISAWLNCTPHTKAFSAVEYVLYSLLKTTFVQCKTTLKLATPQWTGSRSRPPDLPWPRIWEWFWIIYSWIYCLHFINGIKEVKAFRETIANIWASGCSVTHHNGCSVLILCSNFRQDLWNTVQENLAKISQEKSSY